MKPALFLSAPPLAFFAAAMLAGLVPPNDLANNSDGPISSSHRKRATVIEDSKSVPTDIKSALAEMERWIGRDSSPEVEIHDAAGMENYLLIDRRKSPYVGGVDALNYSIHWAMENPAEMFEWFILQGLVPCDQRKSLAAELFSEWAKQNMVAALAAITRISDAESRAQALVSTLEVLCQNDPAKARELLLQNVDLLEVSKSVEFGKYDPGKARTELISSLPPGRLRSMLMAENISSLMYCGIGCGGDMSSYYAKAAVGTGLWNELSNDERRELVDVGLRLSVFDEIQLDGLEDLIKQRAETSNDPRQAALFIDQYGAKWAERDASAAVSWALAHLKGTKRMPSSLFLIGHAEEKDFDAAMQVWRSLPVGTIREETAKLLAEMVPPDHEAEKALLQDSLPKPGKW